MTEGNESSTRSIRQLTLAALKAVISVGAFAYLYVKFPIAAAIRSLFEIDFGYLIVLIPVVMLPIVLTSRSLQLLYNEHEEISFGPIFKVDTIDFIVNSFLPSRVGTLATTPAMLNKYTGIEARRAFVIKGVQMVSIAAINGSVAALGLLVFYNQLGTKVSTVLFISVGAYLSIPVGTILVTQFNPPAFVRNVVPDLVTETVTSEQDVLSPNKIKSTLLLFVSFVVLSGIRFAAVSASQGLHLPLSYYLLIPTLIYSVTILPISVGGIGIAEVTGTTVLVSLGVAPGHATSVIVLDRLFAAYFPLVVLYIYANYVIHTEVTA